MQVCFEGVVSQLLPSVCSLVFPRSDMLAVIGSNGHQVDHRFGAKPSRPRFATFTVAWVNQLIPLSVIDDTRLRSSAA